MLKNDDDIDYFNNTNDMLAMIETDYKTIDDYIDKVVEAIGHINSYEAYLVMQSMCNQIKLNTSASDDHIEWLNYVAKRVAQIRNSSES